LVLFNSTQLSTEVAPADLRNTKTFSWLRFIQINTIKKYRACKCLTIGVIRYINKQTQERSAWKGKANNRTCRPKNNRTTTKFVRISSNKTDLDF
jgi:hypothetical protein